MRHTTPCVAIPLATWTWEAQCRSSGVVYNLVRVGCIDSAHSSSLLDLSYHNVQLITTYPFVERILSYQKADDLVSNQEASMMAILTTALAGIHTVM
jgi:hypothetical protein